MHIWCVLTLFSATYIWTWVEPYEAERHLQRILADRLPYCSIVWWLWMRNMQLNPPLQNRSMAAGWHCLWSGSPSPAQTWSGLEISKQIQDVTGEERLSSPGSGALHAAVWSRMLGVRLRPPTHTHRPGRPFSCAAGEREKPGARLCASPPMSCQVETERGGRGAQAHWGGRWLTVGMWLLTLTKDHQLTDSTNVTLQHFKKSFSHSILQLPWRSIPYSRASVTTSRMVGMLHYQQLCVCSLRGSYLAQRCPHNNSEISSAAMQPQRRQVTHFLTQGKHFGDFGIKINK